MPQSAAELPRMKEMKPADWIAVGALGVAVVSIVMSTLVGPRVAGRIARDQWRIDSVASVYAEAIALMRARFFELDDWAKRGQHEYSGPTESETAATTARLLLFASPDVWPAFEKFIGLATHADVRAAIGLASRGHAQTEAVKEALARYVGPARSAMNEVIDLMAKDVKTRRKPLRLEDA